MSHVDFQMRNMRDLRTILADPAWLPHHIDATAATLTFLRIDRDARCKIPFLDEHHLSGMRDRVVFPLQAVRDATPPGKAPVHFLFHSAFACSTVMARVLDIPGTATALSEPAILNDLASLARQRQPIRPLLDTILALLGRGFAAGETVIVKPSNAANNLAEPIFALRPDTRALLLYTPLRDFLFSIARKGAPGRVWARRTFALLRSDGLFDAGFSDFESFLQTDLQIAAAAWLAHHGQFAGMVRNHPGRVRTLDSQTLLARRAESIAAAGGLFGLDLDASALAAGPAFATDAKRADRAFDPDADAQVRARLAEAHREEIDMVVKWADSVRDFLHVPAQLGAALL